MTAGWQEAAVAAIGAILCIYLIYKIFRRTKGGGRRGGCPSCGGSCPHGRDKPCR